LYPIFYRSLIYCGINTRSYKIRRANYHFSFLLLYLWIIVFTLSQCSRVPVIRFEKEIYDFGVAEEEEKIEYTYVFKNTGREPVVIRHVQSSCVCATVLDYDRTIAPGKKGRIPITFTAPRYNGNILKLINVKTNVPEQETIRLIFKGKVIIPVELVPRNAWLGDVNEETKFLSGGIEIRNNTKTPLRITEIIPPDDTISYTLTTLKKGEKYRLDYIMYPPFEGRNKVEKQFTVKTNLKEKEYVYHKFFFYIK
jgi:hypothetical protein